MKNFDEIKSVEELDYRDYLEYKDMLDAKAQKIVGKTEVLYLLPMLVSLLSLGLLPISALFLLFSVPVGCLGFLFTLVAGKTIHVNICKKIDNKSKLKEYKRLKDAKQLSRIAKLMAEFEQTDRFKEEQLKYEILTLKRKIEGYKNPYNRSENEKVIELLEQELREKEHLLNVIQNTDTSLKFRRSVPATTDDGLNFGV